MCLYQGFRKCSSHPESCVKTDFICILNSEFGESRTDEILIISFKTPSDAEDEKREGPPSHDCFSEQEPLLSSCEETWEVLSTGPLT